MIDGKWLGAVEGYYGPPLRPADRHELVEWLASQGFNAYGYAPKDDPYHRQRWREPYPTAAETELADLVALGRRVGIRIGLVLSPGLDWTGSADDRRALVGKLGRFRELGADVLGLAFDDVTPGGEDLGRLHGAAVAAAVDAIDGVEWITCPTDYGAAEATDYLRGYAAEIPAGVEVMWTGSGVVTPVVTEAHARRWAETVGRTPLFAENYPVNDGAMSGVLHLGPYPTREAGLVEATSGVFCNVMSRPLASRVGLACAAAFWRDPTVDPEAAWLTAVTSIPGLLPLAAASRTWVGRGALAPALADALEAAEAGNPGDLLRYLYGGCRDGLDPALAAEIEPWLRAWEHEAEAMKMALTMLTSRAAGSVPPASLGFVTGELWKRARASEPQVFGARWAYYPVTRREQGVETNDPSALVMDDHPTDRLCRRALGDR